jgi:glycerol-1-phosphate dehydrogenase [NAD(P)+]
MKLPYDPADGEAFWRAIRGISEHPGGSPEPLLGPMLFESDALLRIPEVLRRVGADPARPVHVIMDPVPMRRGADSLKPTVLRLLRGAGWKPAPVVLEPGPGGQVHTSREQIRAAEAHLDPGSSVISIGSGSVTDIAKQACLGFQERTGRRPRYVACPTANSVGAYTSNVATVFVRGKKRSEASRLPDAVVYDLETLRDAPFAMTVAGAGEMLVSFVSLPDWLVAHRLGMGPGYSGFLHTLMGPLEAFFIEHARGIRERTLEGMAAQAKLISVAGIGCSLLGSSTPLSGYEHVISHLIDLQSALRGEPLALHGTQVILAASLVSEAYRVFLDAFQPSRVRRERCYPTALEMKTRIEESFAAVDPSGAAAAECWGEYQPKLEAWRSNRPSFSRFLDEWPQTRAMIERLLRSSDRIACILAELGSPLGFEELEPPVSEESVRFAFLNAPLTRQRATLGDLLVFLGWDREALWERAWRTMNAAAASARQARAGSAAAVSGPEDRAVQAD